MSVSGINLTRQLSAFNTGFRQRLNPRDRTAVEDAAERLRIDVAGRDIPRPGDMAPDFALKDQHGGLVKLTERLTRGPVVVLFIRGGWCPFCTLTLRAYQAALPAIHDAGADLLAITPQGADSSYVTAERDLLAFPILSDRDNQVAHTYGIAYELEQGVRSLYQRLGHDLPRVNGTNNWSIPLPATFVVAPDRRVVLSHLDTQIHLRLEPAEAVRALQALSIAA